MEAKEKGSEKNVKLALNDIILDVTWSKIAKRYFNRSSGWLYNKLNGVDGNGGKGGFSPEERELLKGALVDLADRLRLAADNL